MWNLIERTGEVNDQQREFIRRTIGASSTSRR
jgi:hypothetical protein